MPAPGWSRTRSDRHSVPSNELPRGPPPRPPAHVRSAPVTDWEAHRSGTVDRRRHRRDPSVGRRPDRGRADRGRPDQPQLPRQSSTATPHFVRIPGVATDLLAVDRGNERHNTRRRGRGRGRAAGAPPAAGLGRVRRSSGSMRRRCRMTRSQARRRCRRGSPRRCVGSMPDRGSATTSTWSGSASATSRVVDERGIAIPAGYREHLGADAEDRGRASRRVRCRRSPATTTCWPRTTSTTAIAPVDRRLRVQRQQRPDLRTRQHRPGTRLRRRRGSASCAPRTSARRRTPSSPGCGLQMIMSDVGWTLWAAIQAGISPIDFDFCGLGRGALGSRRGGDRRAGLRGLARGDVRPAERRPRPIGRHRGPAPGRNATARALPGPLSSVNRAITRAGSP